MLMCHALPAVQEDTRVDRCREVLCVVVARGESSRSLQQLLRVNSSARDQLMFQLPPTQKRLMRTRSPGAIDRISRLTNARCKRAGDCPFARSSREVNSGPANIIRQARASCSTRACERKIVCALYEVTCMRPSYSSYAACRRLWLRQT